MRIGEADLGAVRALRRPPRRRARADELHAARALLALAARGAAQELAAKMGFEHPEVVHYEQLTDGYTYFVMFGELHPDASTSPSLQRRGVRHRVHVRGRDRSGSPAEHIGRRIVVVGASHRHGHPQRGHRRDAQPEGLPRPPRPRGLPLPSRRTTSAARCPTACSWRKAIDVGADAILVSQTVTQQNLHVAQPDRARRDRRGRGPAQAASILTCGGPRVSNELAKELGYDAGFSKGTYPNHLATFIVRELAERVSAAG